MKLTKKDEELIEIATNVVKNNCDIYETNNSHVACALRTKSDLVYVGMNLKSSHSVCAEQVAIGNAFAFGARDFKTIVAVQLGNDGIPKVVAPCGLCRYIFTQLKLNFNVIVPDGKQLRKVKVKDLLPFPYLRQE